MKKLLLSWVALCVSGFSFAHAAAEGFNPNEITYVVTMSANDKSVEEINAFSSFYHELVEGNEPSTLAWHFYRGSNDKIYLIERYENSRAALQHVKNISPGGIQEDEFGDFTEHFIIENIIIHGTPSEELIASLQAVGLPLEFRASISGYNRR